MLLHYNTWSCKYMECKKVLKKGPFLWVLKTFHEMPLWSAKKYIENEFIKDVCW